MRILLIEDDRVLGAAVRDQINGDGHSVDWVQRLDAAALACEAAAFDLVLLDLMLTSPSCRLGSARLPVFTAATRIRCSETSSTMRYATARRARRSRFSWMLRVCSLLPTMGLSYPRTSG